MTKRKGIINQNLIIWISTGIIALLIVAAIIFFLNNSSRKANEEAKVKRESYSRLLEEKAELESSMEINVDKIEGTKWISDETISNNEAKGCIFTIYIAEAQNKRSLRFYIGFVRKDWVFMDRIVFNMDGEVQNIFVPSSERVTKVYDGGIISEAIDFGADDYIDMLKRASTSTKVLIRFSGKNDQYDTELIASQKHAARRVMRLYEVYKELENY